MLKKSIAATCILALFAGSACTSIAQGNAARAENRAYQAQSEVAKERLALVEQYRTCVTDAGADPLAVEACDVFLRSAEALK